MVVPVLIFAFSYLAFSIGRVPGLRSDRMGAAVVGAALMVAFGGLSMAEAQAHIDGATLALLFGMMIVSAALELSGAFGLLAWWLTRFAPSPARLCVAVSLLSALLSAFLINDVVCIALTPVVLSIAEQLDTDPKPHLIALATSSNIGSAATLTGNPQNILIGSLSGIPWREFAASLAPPVVLALLVNLAVLFVVFREPLRAPLGPRSERPRPRIYKRWVRKGSLVAGAVLLGFVAGAPPALVALLGGSAILLTRAVRPTRIYARIDWSLLALFAGLFVLVGGLERIGLGERLIDTLSWIHPEDPLGLTALTALLSNVVSNVPAVMVLKSVVPHLPDARGAYLTLALASTFAGNLTLPGSMATLIVVERARHRVKLGFWEFFRVGAPSAVASLLLGAAWLAWTR